MQLRQSSKKVGTKKIKRWRKTRVRGISIVLYAVLEEEKEEIDATVGKAKNN